MKKLKSNKQKALSTAIITFTFFSFLTHFSRIIKNAPILGKETYFHLRFSEIIQFFGIPTNDFMASKSVPYSFNLIDLILAYLPFKAFFLIAIPYILGLTTLILLYFVLKQLRFKENTIFLSLVLISITPGFIYIFTQYKSSVFIIFLNTLFAYLYLNKKFKLAVLAFLPTAFINPASFLITIALMFLLESKKKIKKEKAVFYSISFSIYSILTFLILYRKTMVPNKLFFIGKDLFTSTISDFGASTGIGVFQLILAIIGAGVIWGKKEIGFFGTKYRYRTLLVLLFFVYIISTYFETLIVFVIFFASILAAIGLITIYERKWELKSLKKVALMLIIYGLLFSTISFQTRIANASPTHEKIKSLDFFVNEEFGVVLSHPSNGYYIEYFGVKPVLMDDRIRYVSQGVELYSDAYKIFYSRNLDQTLELIKKHEIRYIYIDNEMKNGVVWEERDEGLLFLLDKSFEFIKIYDSDGIEIWEVFE